MPKLRKEETADLDVKELDEQEYTETDFDEYEGDVPPTGTELTGYIKMMWWARTAEKEDGGGLDPMLRVLWIAAENEGDEAEFNGCPFWESLALVGGAKFRWAPFLEVYGITLKAIKTAVYVGEEDDERFGAPIERIGNFHPGEDHDEAWARIISKHGHNNAGVPRAEVKKWLPWESEDGEESPEDSADEYDDEADEADEYDDTEAEDTEEYDEAEAEDEPEPEPARPARGRARATAKPAAAKGRPAARAAAARPAAASTSSRGRKPAAAKAAPARRGRKPAQDEPPF